MVVENCDIIHQVEEAEKSLANLSKEKASLATRLEDAKRLADAETRVNIYFLQYKSYLQ